MGRFITGIYKYCDYWCERCPFTRQCRNYADDPELLLKAMEAEQNGNAGEDAADAEEDRAAINQEFWDRLAANLRHATIFREPEHTGQWDGDWDDADDFVISPEEETAYLEEQEKLDAAVKSHRLTHLADAYNTQAGAWLEAPQTDAALKAIAAQWMDEAGKSAYDSNDYEEAALELKDILAVIGWYQTLIPGKLHRAIRGHIERCEEMKKQPPPAYISRFSDADGSAKVVLVAIERSMAAWLRLREFLPSQEDDILTMLVLLQRMQRGINTVLPGAASFRRPGFDPGPNIFEEDDDPDPY